MLPTARLTIGLQRRVSVPNRELTAAPPTMKSADAHRLEKPMLRHSAVPTNQRTASGTLSQDPYTIMEPDTLPTQPRSFLKLQRVADRACRGKNTEVAIRIQPLLTQYPPPPAGPAIRRLAVRRGIWSRKQRRQDSRSTPLRPPAAHSRSLPPQPLGSGSVGHRLNAIRVERCDSS